MDHDRSVLYLESFWKFGIKLGLHRIEKLLRELGDPQKKIKTVHVAGTNGKGSVCAMVSLVLREAGYRTGLFTSPHLFTYMERFKINGKDIPENKFNGYVGKVRAVINKYEKGEELPTEFEILTAIAFLYFADENVTIAVIETGLGGRLDSTNVITPLVSVITNVDLDHTEVLGKTIELIAKEKAGIIKDNIPVVTAAQGKALSVIKKTAAKKKGRLVIVSGPDLNLSASIPLYGQHQKINAATAVAAVAELRKSGYKISDSDIRIGIAKTKWPARFQILRRDPVVIVDGAHNPAGIKALIDSASAFKNRSGRDIFVAGILRRKDHKKMLSMLCSAADTLILTRPMAKGACTLAEMGADVKGKGCEILKLSTVGRAVTAAIKIAGKDDTVIICGSLFTAAEALALFPRHLTHCSLMV
ncbi:MAG: bifunctional folylpolyglutamate synthase/dihydrofolate synthase [Candidatus Saganbacteria bacterium]|nr:bifunctional folylpolyglutamate synthase/dihydrofolate synthase [Candidatus Saganbacteria bacterium]